MPDERLVPAALGPLRHHDQDDAVGVDLPETPGVMDNRPDHLPKSRSQDEEARGRTAGRATGLLDQPGPLPCQVVLVDVGADQLQRRDVR